MKNIVFAGFLSLSLCVSAQEIGFEKYSHGIFKKLKKKSESIHNKDAYSTHFSDGPNGVNEYGFPKKIWRTNYDSTFIQFEIHRDYEGGLIKQERIGYPDFQDGEHGYQINYKYSNERDVLFRGQAMDPLSFYHIQEVYRDRSFFYSPIGYSYSYYIMGENTGYGPDEYYLNFDSTVAVIRGGEFRGYRSYFDPTFTPEIAPGGKINRDLFVVEYEMDIRPLSEDSALVYEYFYNKSTESHDTVIQYASLKDGFLHTVYEEIPGSGAQEFQKVVYEAWHDPFEFVRKEWAYYETKDGGETWVPLSKRYLDGIEWEWIVNQYFEYQDGEWVLDGDYYHIYNPITRRKVHWVSKSTISDPDFMVVGIVQKETDLEGRILHETRVSLDSSNVRNHYFYSDFGGPNSSIKESVSHPWLVYPNPCSNELKILNGRGMGKVFNLEGREIMRLNMSQEIHDVSKLPAGLYKMVDDNGVCLGFVKQ